MKSDKCPSQKGAGVFIVCIRCPLLWKTCYNFYASPKNKLAWKLYLVFRGISFGLAVRVNNSPIRCIKITALPLGAYWGGLVAVEKIYNWKCVGKRHGWWLNATEQWVGEWNEALLAVCGRSICGRVTADWRNGMTALICGVEWRSHLCRAVLRWVK